MTRCSAAVAKPNGAIYGEALKSFGVNHLVQDILTSAALQVEVLED
ncbi:hypothetical protein N9F34_02965 [Alphaproteobacteria bacterium]|nr:hypothetical protein [Alphaproteobacteria bacterium]